MPVDKYYVKERKPRPAYKTRSRKNLTQPTKAPQITPEELKKHREEILNSLPEDEDKSAGSWLSNLFRQRDD